MPLGIFAKSIDTNPELFYITFTNCPGSAQEKSPWWLTPHTHLLCMPFEGQAYQGFADCCIVSPLSMFCRGCGHCQFALNTHTKPVNEHALSFVNHIMESL